MNQIMYFADRYIFFKFSLNLNSIFSGYIFDILMAKKAKYFFHGYHLMVAEWMDYIYHTSNSCMSVLSSYWFNVKAVYFYHCNSNWLYFCLHLFEYSEYSEDDNHCSSSFASIAYFIPSMMLFFVTAFDFHVDTYPIRPLD